MASLQFPISNGNENVFPNLEHNSNGKKWIEKVKKVKVNEQGDHSSL